MFVNNAHFWYSYNDLVTISFKHFKHFCYLFTEDLTTCRKELKSTKNRESKLATRHQLAKVRVLGGRSSIGHSAVVVIADSVACIPHEEI